jgi:succinate-semialdehyde dehydrogenase / glutarate-semialdehyde dehydrogenase
MTREQGKPIAENRGEVACAASFIEWFAEESKRIYGDTIPCHGADKRIVILTQPIGVCAAITPWNFPAARITRKAGPALAVGCTMVVKPASQTPFSALALAELAERSCVPKGVFSVVTGSASAIGGEMLNQYFGWDCSECTTLPVATLYLRNRKTTKYPSLVLH